ncbi:hypothetical protein Ancab_017815 [Ancistrocladus abbreviatus]
MEEGSKTTDVVAVAVREEDNQIPQQRDSKATMLTKLLSSTSAAVSLFSFFLSLPILALVIWLLYMGNLDCERILRLPTLRNWIIFGLVLLFLISNAVVYLRRKFPVPGFLVVMVPLITMFTVGLALVGGYKQESRLVRGSPMWINMKVNKIKNWNNIKPCIYGSRVCDDLITRSLTLQASDFTLLKLTSIESGCCKPPPICGMEYVNATYWRKGEDSTVDPSDPYYSDCGTWKNSATDLCFNCQSCKDGFIQTLHEKWGRLGVFLIAMSMLLIVCHLLLFLATMWDRFGR